MVAHHALYTGHLLHDVNCTSHTFGVGGYQGGRQACPRAAAQSAHGVPCWTPSILIPGNAAIGEVDEEKPGIAALERQMLQKRIGEPLAAVQTLLQRDKVVWSTGFLATPSVRVQKD